MRQARSVDQRTVDLLLRKPVNYSNVHSLTGRTQVPCSDLTGRVLNIVFFGQSTNNNSVTGSTYAPPNGADIFNLSIAHGGALFNDAKPLLASDQTDDHHGRWIANQLVELSVIDKSVLTMCAYGGSIAAEWVPGGHVYGSAATWVEGDLAYRLGLAARCIANAGLSHLPTIVDWQQGEWDSDTGTSQANHTDALGKIIAECRRVGLLGFPHQVMFVHQCTRPSSTQANRDAIRAAQAAVCDGVTVRLGADTDTLGSEYRPDGTHFNAAGAAAQAALKVTAYSSWLGDTF